MYAYIQARQTRELDGHVKKKALFTILIGILSGLCIQLVNMFSTQVHTHTHMYVSTVTYTGASKFFYADMHIYVHVCTNLVYMFPTRAHTRTHMYIPENFPCTYTYITYIHTNTLHIHIQMLFDPKKLRAHIHTSHNTYTYIHTYIHIHIQMLFDPKQSFTEKILREGNL